MNFERGLHRNRCGVEISIQARGGKSGVYSRRKADGEEEVRRIKLGERGETKRRPGRTSEVNGRLWGTGDSMEGITLVRGGWDNGRSERCTQCRSRERRRTLEGRAGGEYEGLFSSVGSVKKSSKSGADAKRDQSINEQQSRQRGNRAGGGLRDPFYTKTLWFAYVAKVCG